MSRVKNIKELLKFSNEQLLEIEKDYNLSLTEKEISPKLQILIKCYSESLNSCLDYCARDIYEIILQKQKKDKKNVCFPIRTDVFHFNNAIKGYLPDLENKNQSLFDFIKKIQPYNSGYEWLSDFKTLVNDYKHLDLIPQVEKRKKMLKICNNNGGKLIINGIFKACPGAIINNKLIEKKALILDPNKEIPQKAHDYFQNISVEVWKDFIFENINKPALPLLKQSYVGIEKIINDIYLYIS